MRRREEYDAGVGTAKRDRVGSRLSKSLTPVRVQQDTQVSGTWKAAIAVQFLVLGFRRAASTVLPMIRLERHRGCRCPARGNVTHLRVRESRDPTQTRDNGATRAARRVASGETFS